MTRWAKKHPSKYPIYFGEITIDAAESGEPRLLTTKATEIEVYAIRDQFHEWRFNLREFGYTTQTAKIENTSRITTKIKTIDGGPRKLFQLWLEIKPKLLGTLHLLNPELMEEVNSELGSDRRR